MITGVTKQFALFISEVTLDINKHLHDYARRMFNSDIKRLQHETAAQKEAIKENKEKIKLNKQVKSEHIDSKPAERQWGPCR